MKFDVNGNLLILADEKGELKPSQKSQLAFWGFKKNTNNELYSDADNLGYFIDKIYSYLSNYVDIDLLPNCQKLYSEFKNNRSNLYRIFTKARKYKNGAFDKSEFREFASFLDSNLVRKLRDHQKKSAYHLYLLGNGANFSVPGSGKTSIVLGAYERLRFDGLTNVLFVVGPPACFGPWRFEFAQTLGREPDYRILAGGNSSERTAEYFKIGDNLGELYLTSFQTLLNDQSFVRSFFANSEVKPFLVIDEAHYIKQVDGEWAKAVLSLAPLAGFRCILTGTPLPKSFTDVFNLFDFLYPNFPPIDESAKSRIVDLEKQKKFEDAKSLLDSKIGPLFYRVRKKELGLIPAVFHDPILIKMNKYEDLLYKSIVQKIRDYSKDDYLKNIDLVNKMFRGRMIRLRQCTSYAKLLSTALDEYEEDLFFDESDLASVISNYDKLEKPAKLLRLIELIDNFQKEKQKVIIWSNFRGSLKLIKSEFRRHGYRSEMIYGDTPTQVTSLSDEKTREQIRDEFVDSHSGLDILIANPAACAESISLHTTCFHAIYYDLSYNCAQYLQSLDRIHRIGGSEINQANYYFLQYENTIDKDVLANLRQKAKRMDAIIEKDYEIYSLDMFAEDGEVEAYIRVFGLEKQKDV